MGGVGVQRGPRESWKASMESLASLKGTRGILESIRSIRTDSAALADADAGVVIFGAAVNRPRLRWRSNKIKSKTKFQ